MSTSLAPVSDLPSLCEKDLERVYGLESKCRELENERPAEIPTEHFLHAGMYVRTCLLRKGCALVGALIKIPTVVIVNGDCLVNSGQGDTRITGYNVFRGGAMRKQVFVAIEDTYISMCFGTDLNDLSQCEEAFTDEFENLMTRRN